MNFSRASILKLVLSLGLAVSPFSGAIAQADGAPPTPPTATAVSLNTYGSLPVVVLNLTQSCFNMSMSTTSTSYGQSLPIAAGLPGVYYLKNGSTPFFANILTPTINNQTTNTAWDSLQPIATINPTTNAATSSNSYGWMSMFTAFPSWTLPASYNNVQYVALSNINNTGAAANSYNVVSGYPDGNGKNATTSGHYTSASALNAGQPSTTTISLMMLDSQYNDIQGYYNININSLGGGTPGNVSVPSTGFSILKAMHSVLNVVTDIATCASGDPLGIIDFIAGIPATIDGIATDVSNNSSSTNVNITTDTAYPAKSKGINVSATANYNGTSVTGAALTAVAGDSQSLIYEVQSTTNQALPLVQQNAVFVTTWRQMPADNYGITLPNGTDALFITIINQGIYASNQVQQYINNNSPAQMAGGAKYKPTKAQAQDTMKILAILTAISQKNPQDAKTIIDMFGTHGKYDQIKNDPSALKNMNIQLKTIFEKYSKDLPAIEQYLTKLAQK